MPRILPTWQVSLFFFFKHLVSPESSFIPEESPQIPPPSLSLSHRVLVNSDQLFGGDKTLSSVFAYLCPSSLNWMKSCISHLIFVYNNFSTGSHLLLIVQISRPSLRNVFYHSSIHLTNNSIWAQSWARHSFSGWVHASERNKLLFYLKLTLKLEERNN